MNKIFLLFLLFVGQVFADKITIAVAANVSYAIKELKKEFEKNNPDTQVRVTLGGSGILTAQIKNRAPYGLFMSADMKYPNTLYKDGLALEKPVVYAQGSLAMFSVKKRDFSKGLELLKDKKIRRIAIANPKIAPYGKAAVQALKKANLHVEIKSKLLYAESISQTLSYSLIAADIGLIAKSSLYSKKMRKYKENINYIDVNTTLYEPIKQGIILLKYGEKNSSYKKFYNFVLSEKAKKILKKYGYII